MDENPIVDALVIGGGPAGLSAGLTLARQRFNVIVFDVGNTPMVPAKRFHLIPSWDHQDKDHFISTAKINVSSRYDTLSVERTRIERVQKLENGFFEATDSKESKWVGKKVVLAMGVKHNFPDIEGYAECWGKGIYRCCFCNAFEDRGAHSAGVLAVTEFATVPMAMHAAQDFRRFAGVVNIYTNGSKSLAEELHTAIKDPKKVVVNTEPIQRLEKTGTGGEVTIHFENGTSYVEGFMGHMPSTTPNGPFVEDLGVETEPSGDVKLVGPFNATNVPGVYAAGDICSIAKIVSHAFYLGNLAGAGAAEELLAESG